MNKLIVTIIFTVIIINLSFGQHQKYPKGAYMSFNKIIKKSPSKQTNLNVFKRTKGDIKMVGGNDYKLTSEDKAIKKKFIKKEVRAYSMGDTLYINCFHYKVQPWYTPVISDGDYLVLRGGISQNLDEQKKQMEIRHSFGAIGGAFAGAKMALLRFLYIIDKNTNEIFTVTPEYLIELLREDNQLLERFNNETEKESEETLLKYLKLINEK